MENNYYEAGLGLKKMYIGTLVALICTCLMFIPIVGGIAAIATVVCSIIVIVGLYQAAQKIEGCNNAFVLSIINIIMQICAIPFANSGAIFSAFFNIVQAVISILIIYWVCTAVGKVLEERGQAEIAKVGKVTWILSAIMNVAGIVISILNLGPVLAVIASPFATVVLIGKLTAEIVYIVFLNKSAHALAFF